MPIRRPTHSLANRPGHQCKSDRVRAMRNTGRWQKVRKIQLERSPLCSCGAPAAHAHHVKPLSDHPELCYSMANLQSLCAACHERHHTEHATDNTRETR